MIKIEVPSLYGNIAKQEFEYRELTDTGKNIEVTKNGVSFILGEIVKEYIGSGEVANDNIIESIHRIYPKLYGQLKRRGFIKIKK